MKTIKDKQILVGADFAGFPLKEAVVAHLKAKDIMSVTPKMIGEGEYATKALSMMRASSITQLVVVDSQKHYLGVVHLHDILREGII